MIDRIERIGIVGGGQLGRMLTEAAKPLGFSVTVLDPTENCPAAQVGADQLVGGLHDEEAITRLAEASDVVTWEIEHIAANHLEALQAQGHNVQPSPTTLREIQDKSYQKDLLRQTGIPVAPFCTVEYDDDLPDFAGPYVVKAKRGGFDGRSNLPVATFDLTAINDFFKGEPIYVEKAIPFEKEIAVIAARGADNKIVTYPTVETIHRDSICNLVLAPAQLDPAVAKQADDIAHETLKILAGAGVFAIEMFVADGQVMVNEIAPRVHNSGHFSIEASQTSQFEQHIRAITGMPLGETRMRSAAAVMINILGTRTGELDRTGLEHVLRLPNTYVHFYGKTPRPARKIGHITVLGSEVKGTKLTAEQARKELINL